MWIQYHQQQPTNIASYNQLPDGVEPETATNRKSRARRSMKRVAPSATVQQSSTNIRNIVSHKVFLTFIGKLLFGICSNVCLLNLSHISQWQCFSWPVWIRRLRFVKQIFKHQWAIFVLLLIGDVVINTLMLWYSCTIVLIDTTSLSSNTGLIFFDFDPRIESNILDEQLYGLRRAAERINQIVYIVIYVVQGIGLVGIIKQQESLIITFVTIVAIELIFLLFSWMVELWLIPVYLYKFVLFFISLQHCLWLSDQNMITNYPILDLPTIDTSEARLGNTLKHSRLSLWSKTSSSSSLPTCPNVIPLKQQS